MISTTVRLATENDAKSLAEMHPYTKHCSSLPLEEEILVAEAAGKVLGAVSVGHKEIACLPKEWRSCSRQPTLSDVRKVSGPWISKLFVLPEYRYHGIGTKLVREAVKHLEKRGFTEFYAGVYIKNAYREVSLELFKDNGFQDAGSCICFLSEGHCQGTLLKKSIASSKTLGRSQLQTEQAKQELNDEICKLGLSMGAELIGFAPAEKLEEGAPKGHRPSDLMSNAKSVIILACGPKLNEDRTYFYKWGPDFSLTYIRLKDEVKQRRKEARQCMTAVKSLLAQRGFGVVTEPHGWSGILSFKMAAHLGGLGVFGKGSFLVHPRLGPLNVIACILTDASLKEGNPLKVDVCKDCTECIKACKYGAFKKQNESYKWIGEKCRSYDLIMNPVTLKWTYGPCNSKCVTACPVGKTA
jgi:epoxyqueuosine reductase QueG/GNAT superfamily N-acetyltransferase